MPGPPWGADSAADEEIIASNVADLLRDLAAAASQRDIPRLAMADAWHRRVYARVGSVPSPGAPAADVAAELAAFESSLRLAIARLDGELRAGARPSTSEQVLAVVRLCALAHGEWVRIHPYANGNGRTARVWANWVALRYGLPPFVRIKPRPDGLLYGLAAHRSMGVGGAVPDHDLTFSVFVDLLRSQP